MWYISRKQFGNMYQEFKKYIRFNVKLSPRYLSEIIRDVAKSLCIEIYHSIIYTVKQEIQPKWK